MAGRASVAALKGNAVLHVEWIRRADAEDWQSLAPSFRAQIALDRGISYRVLDQLEEARHWLDRARADAEEHRLNQLAFRSEAELAALLDADAPQRIARREATPEDAHDPRVTGVLRELTAMRAGL